MREHPYTDCTCPVLLGEGSWLWHECQGMSFCLGAAGSHRLGRGWAWRWRCLGWSWVWGGIFRLLSCCHRLNRGRSWSHVTGAEAPKVRPKLPLFAFKCVFSSLPTLGPPNSRALKQVGPERALGPCQPQTDTCLWWAACADSCDCVPRSAQMQLGFKSPLSLTETTIPCLSSLIVKPQATTGGARIDFRPVWGAELCRAATVGELGFWGAAWVRANSGHHRPTQALPWDQVAPVSVWVFSWSWPSQHRATVWQRVSGAGAFAWLGLGLLAEVVTGDTATLEQTSLHSAWRQASTPVLLTSRLQAPHTPPINLRGPPTT